MKIQELKYWIPIVNWVAIVRDDIELRRRKRLKTVTAEDYTTYIDNSVKVVMGHLMVMLIIVIVGLIVGK